MSNFNFLPKYHYQFYLFNIAKQLEGETNISKNVSYFYEQEMNKIRNYINHFYTRLFLTKEEDFGKIRKLEINLYQNLLKLKKTIRKTYENAVPFYKLYEYSKQFPFKYINIQLEDDQSEIKFDESLRKKSFKLRYSFPLVEKVVESMIEEYNNDDKIDITELSGSIYGNALEIKIRKN